MHDLPACRLSCCVAGNSNLVVKEEDVKEMLQLVEARLWPPVAGEPTAPSASNSGIIKLNSTGAAWSYLTVLW